MTAFTPPDSQEEKNEAWQILSKEKVVYANHAYMVMRLEGKSIRLRNPWGMRHPKPLCVQEFKTMYLVVSINQA